MKENIIAAVTLISVFALFFSYKINSNDSSLIVSETDVNFEKNDTISDSIDLNINSDLIDQDIEIIIDNEGCSMTQLETDSYSFSEAFNYYRNCLGKDQVFSWNSRSYKTLLATEISNDIENDVENMIVKSDQIVDKNHLNLLNQMIGEKK